MAGHGVNERPWRSWFPQCVAAHSSFAVVPSQSSLGIFFMRPADEHAIAQYVRDPASMPAEARRAVDALLAADAGAAAYAQFLEEFYDRLDEEQRSAPNEQVEAFVSELFGDADATVIPMEPCPASSEARPTVLAAATSAAEKRRFVVLATLRAQRPSASSGIVRVLKDRSDDRGHLYVLTDPPAHAAHTVVSFPTLGLDLVTDEQGRLTFDLPADVAADQWAEAPAVVRRPVATTTLGAAAETVVPLPGGGRVRCRRNEKRLVATPAATGSGGPTLLTVHGASPSPLLLPLSRGTSAEAPLEPAGSLTLRVYD